MERKWYEDDEYSYDRKPDEDRGDEEKMAYRKWKMEWDDEHPFNQRDFL